MSLRKALLSRVSSSSIGLFGESRSWSRRERDAGAGEVSGGVADGIEEAEAEGDEGGWSGMLPELLEDIMRRVEASGEKWPLRKDVVSTACVCRRWREVVKGIVKPPFETGNITLTWTALIEAPSKC